MKSQPTEPNKTKILYVITQGGPWGGAQRYVFDLTTSLADQFDVTVAIGEPDENKALQQKLSLIAYRLSPIDDQPTGINVVQLKHLIRRVSPWHDLLAAFELAKLYKTIKPNIVHLNSSKAGVTGSIAGLLARYSGFRLPNPTPKIVYTAHGWVFLEPLSWLKRTLYLRLEKITARWKDKIIVLSEPEKQTAQQSLTIPTEKLAVIPLGINTTEAALSPAEARAALQALIGTKLNPRGPLIGTIANCYPTKGLDLLIEAVAIARSHLGNSHVIIIGDGPERKKLEALTQARNVADIVHFTGFLEAASKYLTAFSIFVLPSRKEGLPYTLLEAMRHKIPVIATSVGGIPALIEDKKQGLLVPPEDIVALAQAIRYAHEHYEAMTGWAEIAQSIVYSRLSLTVMIEQTTALYWSLIRE